MSTAGSISDSQLGLTQSELMIMRQAQEVATQTQSRSAMSATPDRGRGTSRHSQPSSRNASAASSRSIQGRITMDSASLGRIENALNAMVRQIASRIRQLEEAAEQNTETNNSRSRNAMQSADDEIARAKKIMAQLDALDEKMEEVQNVCEKIRGYREKCDRLGGRIDQIALNRIGARPPK